MSDPFDVLREVPEADAPPVGAIVSRARAIERRRRTLLSTGAVAAAVIAVAGVLWFGEPGQRSQLAQETFQRADDASQEVTSSQGAAGTVADAVVSPEPPRAASKVVGGGAVKSAPGSDASATTGTSSAARAESNAPDLTVTVSVQEQTVPRGAELTLSACNKTQATIEKQFNDAQRYDFEVKRGTSLVWKWSDGMTFAQVVGKETWKPNECKTWTESWDGTTREGGLAPSGKYDAVGILATDPEQRSAAKPFCLAPC